jgi:integrase
LKYVAALKRKSATQVFPELKPDKRGVWTGAMSAWLNRYLNAIGITDPRKVMHSFRHAFKDACRKARIPESVHDALTGHANGSVGRSYGLGEPLEVLADAVAKIAYQVDLKHLQRHKSSTVSATKF